MADKKISQLTELTQVNVDVDADYFAIVDSSATETKKVLVDAAVLATLSQSSVPSINGTTIPTSKTLVVTTDIGTTVQAYDADTAKYDDTTANFTGTLQNGGSNVVVDSDIGSTVQAYDANTAKYDDTTANFTGTLQNGGSNVLVDTDIGTNVQAYDADTAKYDDTTANFTGTLQNGGHTVLTDASDYLDSADIGVNVLAYDSNLQAFVTTFALPEADGSADQVLKTDGAGNIGFATVSTSAAGSDTQIQYNSAGSFAGASGLTTDGSNLTIGAQGDLRLADSDSSNYIAFQAPATVATNVTFTLPDADGTTGQALTTNGSGALAWSTVAGSPGGSDTQLQFNNAGSFGGASGLVTDGSNLTINAQGDLRFADSDSSNWVAFQAPATVSSNVTWTLPDADGSNGQVLSTNGSGTLSWASGAAGGSSISAGDSSVEVTDTGSDGTITFDTDGSERMRIDSSGRVGIGETSPTHRLQVAGNNGSEFKVTRGTNNCVISLANNVGSEVYVGPSVSSPLVLQTNNTERMRITTAGDFLVGTTGNVSVNGKNEFRGTQTSGGESVLAVFNSSSSGADASPPLCIYKAMTTTTSSARFIQFFANSGSQAMGGIVGNGATNVQFASISDVREKTNIQSISGSLEKINALNPVEFDWIKNGEHCSAGFVAQDVETVFPEYVIENFSQEGEEPRKALTGGMTAGIVPHLVKAIQELKAELNIVKAELATLKG